MFKFKVTWDKIITDVFSSLILCIVGGAALIVWQGATTVEEKVDNATTNIKLQQDYLGKAILVIEKEIIELKEKDKELEKGKSSISQHTIPTPSEEEFVVPQEQLEPSKPNTQQDDPSLNNIENKLPPLPVYKENDDKIPNDLIRQQLPEQTSL